MKVVLKQNNQVIQQFFTYSSGEYSFEAPLGTSELELDTTYIPLRVACPASLSRSVVLSSPSSLSTDQNWGLSCGAVDFSTISIYAAGFRPGAKAYAAITAGNHALLQYGSPCGGVQSGTVTTIISGPAEYTGPDTPAVAPSSIAGNTLTYNISDLNSLSLGSFDIILLTDSTAMIDSSVCITTIISPDIQDANQADDTLMECFTIKNSHDPNLKEVYPRDEMDAEYTWLTYTIHFQNTGNDTAYKVIVRDTLSSDIDASTFQYISSSHPPIIQLRGNAMTFVFNAINLPDSVSDPIRSQGWIQYKVKALRNLPIGTVIRNRAAIYFDNNAAIMTNTTLNTVKANERTHEVIKAHLYPNPNIGEFTLETTNAIGGDFAVYDMMGHLAQQQSINSNKSPVNLSGLASGVYTLRVRNSYESSVLRFTIAQ